MACRLVLRLGSHLLAMTSLLPRLRPGGIHNLRLSHFHQGADVMPMAKDKLPNDRPKQNPSTGKYLWLPCITQMKLQNEKEYKKGGSGLPALPLASKCTVEWSSLSVSSYEFFEAHKGECQ